MPEMQHPSSRKRQHSEPPQPNETSQPIPKKQRLRRSSDSETPVAFWNNLSKIWLTKRALRELDRRNTQAALSPPRSPQRQVHRPVAPNFAARGKKNRQICQHAADYIRSCKPSVLKSIKSLAQHGGPDLSDLTNFPEPPIHPPDRTNSSRSSSQSRLQGSAIIASTKPTIKTKTTGMYDRNFHQHLVDNAIYPDAYEYSDDSVAAEPNNREDFKQILALPRPSLSPSQFSDRDFTKFRRAVAHATKEKQVLESVVPIIDGKIEDARCRSGGIPFTNLGPLTSGSLKPGNPDLYYGARPEQLRREVCDELGGHIIPSTQHDLPIAPSFFLTAKGPNGSAAVAKRQACYNGALGARGMHSLQSHGRGEPVYDNNAYTVTSTYHDGTLKMYTSHVVPPRIPGDRPGYNMTQLRSFAMTDTPDTCRNGLRAYRNARDWCKDKRDEFISQANERMYPVEAEEPTNDAGASPAPSFVTVVSGTEAQTISQGSWTSLNEYPNIRGGLEESDSSVEHLVDFALPAKRSCKRSKRSHTRQKRHNASESRGTRLSRESGVTYVPDHSSASNATIEQSARWSWTSRKFQCHKGQDLVKEQNETPADVWIYFDQGWPGQDGKKWRLWISATREILYS